MAGGGAALSLRWGASTAERAAWLRDLAGPCSLAQLAARVPAGLLSGPRGAGDLLAALASHSTPLPRALWVVKLLWSGGYPGVPLAALPNPGSGPAQRSVHWTAALLRQLDSLTAAMLAAASSQGAGAGTAVAAQQAGMAQMDAVATPPLPDAAAGPGGGEQAHGGGQQGQGTAAGASGATATGAGEAAAVPAGEGELLAAVGCGSAGEAATQLSYLVRLGSYAFAAGLVDAGTLASWACTHLASAASGAGSGGGCTLLGAAMQLLLSALGALALAPAEVCALAESLVEFIEAAPSSANTCSGGGGSPVSAAAGCSTANPAVLTDSLLHWRESARALLKALVLAAPVAVLALDDVPRLCATLRASAPAPAGRGMQVGHAAHACTEELLARNQALAAAVSPLLLGFRAGEASQELSNAALAGDVGAAWRQVSACIGEQGPGCPGGPGGLGDLARPA
jgi:hypothetical protein